MKRITTLAIAFRSSSMRLPIAIVMLLILLCTEGATIPAVSTSYTDVSSAVASASTGDTVTIPTGTSTWSSSLIITNAVSLIGNGTNNTIINCGTTKVMEWRNLGNNQARLSGIRFNGYDDLSHVVAILGPTYAFRVDNCMFDKGDSAVSTNPLTTPRGTGPVYGVVDHCIFLNMKRPYFATDVRQGETYWGTNAWNEPVLPGTTNMMVWEDNTFLWDTNMTDALGQGALYGSYGGKCMFRYNTCSGWCFYVDAHGDSGQGDPSTIFYEMYGNTFSFGTNALCFQGELAWQRGGQWMCYSNTFTGSSWPVSLSVYYTTDLISRRVTNTYFWDNTRNGTNDQSIIVRIKDSGQAPPGYSADNIIFNEDYFFNSPQNGQTYFPYTPLVYPHPLIQDGGDVPAPPKALIRNATIRKANL